MPQPMQEDLASAHVTEPDDESLSPPRTPRTNAAICCVLATPAVAFWIVLAVTRWLSQTGALDRSDEATCVSILLFVLCACGVAGGVSLFVGLPKKLLGVVVVSNASPYAFFVVPLLVRPGL